MEAQYRPIETFTSAACNLEISTTDGDTRRVPSHKQSHRVHFDDYSK
jgi:hypothetical protein